MKAAQFRHFGDDVRIAEVEVPVVGENEALVRVAASQIGGDIVKIMAGNGPVRDRDRFQFPHTPGYRGAGVVDAIGSGVEGLSIGDRVVINGFLSCGVCDACRMGLDNLCERSHMIGIDSGRAGAMAEFVKAPAHAIYEIADDVAFDRATLLPNVALIVHALRRSAVDGPFTAAVFGCGLVGSSAVATALAMGATEVIAVDTATSALELARECGATIAVDADREDPVGAITAATNGVGVDVAIEIVGLGETIAQAALSTRSRGVTLLIGALQETTISFPEYYRDVIQREIDLRSCFGKGKSDFAKAVQLAGTGALDLSAIPIQRHPFEAIEEAIRCAADALDPTVHVVTFDLD